MPIPVRRGTAAAAALLPLLILALTLWTQPAAADAAVGALRSSLEQLRREYEQRIAELERRLARAEQDAAQASAQASAAASSQPMRAEQVLPASTAAPAATSIGDRLGAIGAGTAFNPDISVILDGNYYHDGEGGAGADWIGSAFQPGRNQRMGHAHDGHDHGGDHAGHSHGTPENGFNFRSAEISFSGTVDPYFDAALYLAIDGDGNVDLEEGYFQTRALPWGLRVKGGKFLSDFGYINRQHPHDWEFVDQNLPYLNLLGYHGLQDTGLQLTWLTPLPVFTQVGIEALQGNQERFGATLGSAEQQALDLRRTRDGPRLGTAFLNVAPDLGRRHALQLGLSYAHSNQQQLVHEHTHAHQHGHGHGHAGPDHDDDHDHEHGHGHDHGPEIHRAGMEGDADLWGLDLVYKYDAGRSHGQGNFKFQTEYLRSTKDLRIRSSAHPERIGSTRRFTSDGLYAQATYGIAPRWSAGLRYDVFGLTNQVRGGRNLDFGSSDRWTLALTWDLSEFSRLRAQYAYNNILLDRDERQRFDAFYLQFLVSLGSHGAHSF